MQLICTRTCSTCRKAVALLEERGVAFTYREYTKDPLDADELRAVFDKLGVGPRDLLRARDAAKQGLTGDEDDEALIALMAANNRLVQRPILVDGARAVVGRPVEALEALL